MYTTNCQRSVLCQTSVKCWFTFLIEKFYERIKQVEIIKCSTWVLFDFYWFKLAIYSVAWYRVQVLPWKLWKCKGWVPFRFSYSIHHNDTPAWGVIANNYLKMRKIIEFQSFCPATAHLFRWSISRNSNRQVIQFSLLLQRKHNGKDEEN